MGLLRVSSGLFLSSGFFLVEREAQKAIPSSPYCHLIVMMAHPLVLFPIEMSKDGQDGRTLGRVFFDWVYTSHPHRPAPRIHCFSLCHFRASSLSYHFQCPRPLFPPPRSRSVCALPLL